MTEYEARQTVKNVDWQKVGNALATIITEFKPLLNAANASVEALDEDTTEGLTFTTCDTENEDNVTLSLDKTCPIKVDHVNLDKLKHD